MNQLRKCVECGIYTLQGEHHDKQTISPAPAKYSPEDRYAKYRREAKRRQNVL